MLNKFKLTTKIIVVVSSAILGMLIISLSTYIGLSKIGSEIEEISDYQVPINSLITELEKDILEEEILTYQFIIESKNIHSSTYKNLKEKIYQLEDATEHTIKESEKLVQDAIKHNSDEKTKAKYELFLKELSILKKEQESFKNIFTDFQAKLETQKLEMLTKEKQHLHDELNLMDKNIQVLMQQMKHLLEHSTSQAKKDEIFILKTIEIIASIALLLSLLLSYILIKNTKMLILNFQNGVLEFFKYLNRETQHVNPLDDSGNDEIATMAKVINNNIIITKRQIDEDRNIISEVILILKELEQGDFSKRVNTQSSNPTLQELTKLLNQMAEQLENNVENILRVLEEYSNYNYLNKADDTGLKQHLLKLTTGINALGEAITHMLIQSKSIGLTMHGNAQTLVDNVNLLNHSSTNTATALEETSAALEEITSTVAKNSETISKMNTHAKSVKNSVQESQKQAKDTNNSMDILYTQVNAINEAVVLIEQIAFQTNILSLNAAVESATAGEAGKGFAVVAGEVRSLASRSTETAKDIKNLVESATEQANIGKDIANSMINKYETLFNSIEETTQLINHVDQASKEQQLGIEQINEAITQLDRESQQNLSIAHSTQDIAVNSDKLSSKIVDDANAKEFKGKDTVENKTVETSQQPSSSANKKKEPHPKEPKKEPQAKKTNQVIQANDDSNDSWESF